VIRKGVTYWFVFPVVFAITCPSLFAQLHDRFRFDHLRVEEGLSQGSVNALIQDSRGFLWVGTDDGLNRFDGYQFLVFRPDPVNPDAIEGNIVTALTEDPDGDLWIGTSGAGVQRYDPHAGKFSSLAREDSAATALRSSVINVLQVDRKGRLWIGTENAGVQVFDPASRRLMRVELSSDTRIDAVTDLAMTRSGALFVACGRNGLFAIDPESRNVRQIRVPSIDRHGGVTGVSRITLEGSRYLWVGAQDSRLYRYDVRTGVWKTYPLLRGAEPAYNLLIKGMRMDAEGNLWVATASNGLYVLQTINGRLSHVLEELLVPSSLPSSSTRTLYCDRLGNVWIGMNGRGLALHAPAIKEFNLLLRGLRAGEDISIHSFRAIYQDSDSVLWIGGYRGFNRLDRKSGKVTVYGRNPRSMAGNGPFPGMNADNVFVIHPDPVDPQRYLILGTEGGGLYRFDKKTEQFWRIPLRDESGGLSDPSDLTIYEIARAADGTLWIGGSHGLWRWDTRDAGSLPTEVARESFGEQQGGVFAIWEDRNRFLWVGTGRSGLMLLDRLNGDVTGFTHVRGDTTSLSSNSVRCIFEDSRGILWIGTSFGLNRMNRENGTFRSLTRRDGFPNDVIYGILEDDRQYLWMSTNHGLVKFHAEAGVVATYDTQDGLQGNEFNTAAFFRSASGELFFGGVQGLTYFYPDRIYKNQTVPPVVIAGVRSGNRKIHLRNAGVGPDTIRLKYPEESITFTFAALSFYRPEKNRYRYRINGNDQDWIELGYERLLSFAGLGPGEYVLHVQGSNNDGVWNRQGVTVTLIIEPPFWASWWFRILVGLLLAGLVFFGFRWRMTRVRTQERRLSVEVEQRTSELQHANSNLLLEIDERKRAEAEAYRANATKSEFLAHISHEIRTPMNAILGFSELLHDRIHDAELRDYLESISVSGKTLLTLINDILDLSKIEAGKLDLVFKPMSIAGVVDEIRQLFAYQVSTKQLGFEVRIDPGVPQLLYLDETRMRQILLNLVGNAVKFTERGRITIEIRTMAQEKNSCTLLIEVSDTGVGIAPSQQQRVFEPFRQGSRGRNTDYSGTGLGLAITQRLIQMMGGEITLNSRLGSGTSFRITLPSVSVVADTMEMDFGEGHHMRSAAAAEQHSDEPVTGMSQEAESTVSPEDLRALYSDLSGRELLRWERLKRTYIMHEIESFATDLRKRAEIAHYQPLIDWSDRLVREVRSFDMERLPLTLEEFPRILAVIHDKGKEPPPHTTTEDHD